MRPSFLFIPTVALALSLGTLACQSTQPAAVVSAPVVVAPKVLESHGVHNLIQVTPWLYSGSQPEGPASFEELAALGVKTVVCVDGLKPDAEAARAHGIRVVHLPIGYDAVPADVQAGLARLAKEADGPIYVHCHHGKHRGPAAAAIMLRARDGADGPAAASFMKLAGTSDGYTGLWRDVAAFDPSQPGTWAGPFPEAAVVDDFAAGMASLDRNWDRLKLCRDAGWQTPADHPDIVPRHEALMLHEAFRELVRVPMPNDDPQHRLWMEEAVLLTGTLNEKLRQDGVPAEQIQSAFSAVAASCRQCHKAYRD